MTKTTLTLTAAIVAALTTPAAAGELTVRGSHSVEDAVVRVSYGDLRLAEAGDAEALRTRVNRAVRRGCAGLYGSAHISQEWTCRDIASEAAAPQIASAIEAAQSGRALAATTLVVRLARR
jgi:UrcA family protein